MKKRNIRISRALCRVFGMAALSFMAIMPAMAQDKQTETPLTARNVFERINPDALDLLPPTARLDMLDYWDVDSVYHVKNALQGQSWLERVDPDWVRVNVTPVSTFDIKLLPVKGGNIVMTIYTTGGEGQARDSRVEFYDALTLAPLDGSRYFTPATVKDFFSIPKGSATTMKEISEMLPFITVEYLLTPGSDTLEARLTSGEYISIDDWNIAKLFLRPEVKASWKGKYKFK